MPDICFLSFFFFPQCCMLTTWWVLFFFPQCCMLTSWWPTSVPQASSQPSWGRTPTPTTLWALPSSTRKRPSPSRDASSSSTTTKVNRGRGREGGRVGGWEGVRGQLLWQITLGPLSWQLAQTEVLRFSRRHHDNSAAVTCYGSIAHTGNNAQVTGVWLCEWTLRLSSRHHLMGIVWTVFQAPDTVHPPPRPLNPTPNRNC